MRSLLSCLLLSLIPMPAPGADDGEPRCARIPPGDARFIIVGRNTAPAASGLVPLSYADDDARSMYGAAIGAFCFRPEQVTLLTDDDATAESLLAALAEHAHARLGRLFVYISAHGSRAEGIQLDRPLPWDRLHAGIDTVEAKQTFVFLDTCDSGTFNELRQGGAKGTVQIAPRVDEGRFHLTASTGRAYERHYLQGSVATRDFLGIIYGYGSRDDARVISSNDVCRILTHHPGLTGHCEQHIKGGEGVILVPDRRPPGWLAVDEGKAGGEWTYLLGTRRAGEPEVWFPIRSIDLGRSRAQRSDGLPPGSYRLRRIDADRRRCDVAGVSIEPGVVATVTEADWQADPAHCRWLDARERHIPPRPVRGFGVGLGVESPWLVPATAGPFVRLDYQDYTVPGYRMGASVTVSWIPRDPAIEPAEDRCGGIDVAAALFWDPLYLSFGPLDLYAGAQAGGAWTRVTCEEEYEPIQGATALGGARVGAGVRISPRWLLDLTGTVGARSYRWLGAWRLEPNASLAVGGVVAFD